MGIKGWFTIGGLVLTGVAVWLGMKKKEDEHYEKIQKMIRDVDRKKPEENKVKTVEEMTDDIDRAIDGMDIDSDDMEPRARTFEEIEKTYQNMRNVKQAILDRQKSIQKPNIVDNRDILEAAKQHKEDEQKMQELQDKMNDPEWQAEQERLRKEAEEKKEATWKRKVKKAVEQKNFRTLEDLFDQKYAGGPWHPSPASVFSAACSHGDISEEILKMAEEHFGKLWCYSGD